jgi:hypothetical protein
MATAQTIDRARKNGQSAGQYVAPGERGVNVDHVVDLLVSASESRSMGLRRAANALLEAMEDYGPWRVTASRHSGGTGDAQRGVDQNDHITVRVGNVSYHLQVTVSGHLRRITGDQEAELIPPWLPPGAAVPIPRRR